MHFSQLVLRNVARSPLRVLMTLVAIAVMVAAFIFPRTLVDGHESSSAQAAKDRVIVMPKRGWTGELPLRYSNEVRNTDGVLQATGVRWASLQLPGKEDVFFSSNAVEPQPFLAMHPEIVAPAEQKQAFVEDEHSLLVSRDLARERGWKLGDRIVFKHADHPGEWPLTVACVYDPRSTAWAKRSLWMHYTSFNRGLPYDKRDTLGFVAAQVIDPAQAGAVARAIDGHYDAAPVPTLSMEDSVLVATGAARISALLAAFEVVSYLILVVTFSILSNTLSLSIRERTHELGVLRAIGFGPRHIYLLVLGEAAVLGLSGAALGLGLSYPLLEGLVGRVLKERLQWTDFSVPARSAWSALAAVLGLSLLSALVPARAAARMEIERALGRVV
jgi:putative ABC transport system permease protein